MHAESTGISVRNLDNFTNLKKIKKTQKVNCVEYGALSIFLLNKSVDITMEVAQNLVSPNTHPIGAIPILIDFSRGASLNPY